MKIIWSSELKEKIMNIPDKPGCYLMRDYNGQIIYIGKAVSLKKRVQGYFRTHTYRNGNPKQRSLIKSINDFDLVILNNNEEAIITEGKLIKQYQPFYNVLWKDDKNFQYIRLDINSSPPTVSLSRKKIKDKCLYFGPYIKSRIAKLAVKYIEKFFGFKITNKNNKTSINSESSKDLRVKFNIPELDTLSPKEKNIYIKEVTKFLHGNRIDLQKKLSQEMIELSNLKDYESAAEIRDLIFELNRIAKEKINIKKPLKDIKKDSLAGLHEIKEILKIPNIPNTIECFDISNISGTHSVGSMVVAKKGIPSPKYYRRFRIKNVKGINDPGSIGEIIRRRYLRVIKDNLSLPDLIIVDGGITQLKAAYNELNKLKLGYLPIVGLAKKYEEIIWDIENKNPSIILDKNSNGLKVLIRIRDESHRFAISYHRNIRNKFTLNSSLNSIDSVGLYKKEQLLSYFGSIKKIKHASIESLLKVNGIGKKTAEIIYNSFRLNDKN